MPTTEVWRALYGAAVLHRAAGKYVIAVNDDIDPNNADALLWAMSYRANAKPRHARPAAPRPGPRPAQPAQRRPGRLGADRRHAEGGLPADLAAQARVHGARQGDLGGARPAEAQAGVAVVRLFARRMVAGVRRRGRARHRAATISTTPKSLEKRRRKDVRHEHRGPPRQGAASRKPRPKSAAIDFAAPRLPRRASIDPDCNPLARFFPWGSADALRIRRHTRKSNSRRSPVEIVLTDIADATASWPGRWKGCVWALCVTGVRLPVKRSRRRSKRARIRWSECVRMDLTIWVWCPHCMAGHQIKPADAVLEDEMQTTIESVRWLRPESDRWR